MARHRCTENTIDFSRIADGEVWCRTCGRTWTLNENGYWIMSPQEPAPPRAAT